VPGPNLDHRVLVFARTHGHTPAADRAVAAFSRFGEHAAGWVLLGLAGAAVDVPRRRAWLRAARVTVISYAVNQAIKLTVRRRRPDLPGLPPLSPTVTRLSFPSAHATTAFAAARAFEGLLPGTWLYTTATLLAASRPYLGLHYPSDVLAGAALGSALGQLAR
jgi:undecaprenyl-diphosphatase